MAKVLLSALDLWSKCITLFREGHADKQVYLFDEDTHDISAASGIAIHNGKIILKYKVIKEFHKDSGKAPTPEDIIKLFGKKGPRVI